MVHPDAQTEVSPFSPDIFLTPPWDPITRPTYRFVRFFLFYAFSTSYPPKSIRYRLLPCFSRILLTYSISLLLLLKRVSRPLKNSTESKVSSQNDINCLNTIRYDTIRLLLCSRNEYHSICLLSLTRPSSSEWARSLS